MAEIAQQRLILGRWLERLRQIPEVLVVWLEGSLVDERRTNPGADIDVRLALSDEAYDRLWQADKQQILAGLGPILRLIDANWIRALTRDGIVVEIAVYRTSELDNLQLPEWEILLNRLPAGQPSFQRLPPLSPAETWPEQQPLTAEVVWRSTEVALVVMANSPGPFYNGEWHSAKFTLDDGRTELIKLLYRRVGIYYAKRYKHLSKVLPADYLADLEDTYQAPGLAPLAPQSLAEASLRLFAVTGKHLQALSDQAGGGFEPDWYWLLYSQTVEKLCPWLPRESTTDATPAK
jgi:hypothetical protein